MRYPTTVIPPEQQVYNLTQDDTEFIELGNRNGEMALVPVIIVHRRDGSKTQLDMSACVVTYKEFEDKQ